MNAAELAYVEELKAENRSIKSAYEQQIAQLREQLEWFKRQIFGKKSERIIGQDPNQLFLQGLEPAEDTPIEKQAVAAHSRVKQRNGQTAIDLPEDLPTETTYLDLSQEEKVCPKTGQPLVKIGEEVSARLALHPGSHFIKKTIRPKYALPEGEGIRIAPLPESILPRLRVDESFLADLVVKKYADHLPLYRISEGLERVGIRISRQQLSSWMVSLGQVLTPLHTVLMEKIISSNAVFIDESPVKVQAQKKVRTAYMWVLAGGPGSAPPYRCFHYRPGRKHGYGEDLLSDFTGILHSDKYGVYEKQARREGMIWCPCWSHIRRKFVDAETGDKAFRDHLLEEIRQLYLIERRAWVLAASE